MSWWVIQEVLIPDNTLNQSVTQRSAGDLRPSALPMWELLNRHIRHPHDGWDISGGKRLPFRAESFFWSLLLWHDIQRTVGYSQVLIFLKGFGVLILRRSAESLSTVSSCWKIALLNVSCGEQQMEQLLGKGRDCELHLPAGGWVILGRSWLRSKFSSDPEADMLRCLPAGKVPSGFSIPSMYFDFSGCLFGLGSSASNQIRGTNRPPEKQASLQCFSQEWDTWWTS